MFRPAHERSFQYVTSLSYDLVGSTALIKQMGAENYTLLLQELHATFQTIVVKFGGIADTPHSNDGCMCYFGALRADDAAKRMALQAALEIHAAAVRQQWKVRIGMAYGLVAVHNQEPSGLSVNLAGRLQKTAQANEIIVDPYLQDATHTWYDFSPKKLSQALDGFEEVQQLYALVGRCDVHQPAHVPHKVPYLFGRQQTLSKLVEIWGSAKKGIGVSLVIKGQAGLGKTALMHAFVNSIASDLHETVLLRGYPETQSQAFAPVLTFLKSYKLLSRTPQQEKVLRVLTEDFDKTAESSVLENGASMEEKLIDVLIDQFHQLATNQPLLVIFEDCHWFDSSTVKLVSELMTAIGTAPLMLVATTRESLVLPQRKNARKENIQTLDLQSLTQEDAAALIQNLQGEHTLSMEVVTSLIKQCSGVPLFLHEGVRLVIERGLVMGAKGSTAFKLPISSRIKEILRHRIDSVIQNREIPQIASAMASTFEVDMLVKAVASYKPTLQEAEILAQIQNLQAAGIFQILPSLSGVLTYQFSHDEVKNAAYDSIWLVDQAPMHSMLADMWIAQATVSPIAPDLIAKQLQGAARWADALPYALAAGKLNRKKGAHRVAIASFEECVALLEKLSSQATPMAIEVRLLLAGQVMLTHGYGDRRVGQCFRQTLQLGKQMQDEVTVFKSHLGLHSHFLMCGYFDSAQQQVEQAMQSGIYHAHPLNPVLCDFALAMVHFYRGQIQQADALMGSCERQTNTLLETRQLTHNPNVLSAAYRAYGLWLLGQTEQALFAMDTSVQKSKHLPSPLANLQALGIQAMLMYCRGDFLSALTCAQEGIEIGQEGEYTLWLDLAEFMRGAATVQLANQGQKTQEEMQTAIAQMVHAHASWSAKTATLTQTFYLCTLAQSYLLVANYSAAKDVLDKAQSLMEQYGERYYATEVLRTLALLWMQYQHAADWAHKAHVLLNTAYADATDRQIYSCALRVALTMHDWELVSQQKGIWLGSAQTTRELLTQSITLLEANASTHDALRCRQLLAQPVH